MELDPRNRTLFLVGAGLFAVFLCLCALVTVGAMGYLFWFDAGNGAVQVEVEPGPIQPLPGPRIEATPVPRTPVAPGLGQAPTRPDSALQEVLAREYPTYARLQQVIVPTRDLRDLAMRLRPDVDQVPEVVSDRPADYQVGDVIPFWVSNVDDNRHFQIEAELIYRNDVVYVWVERGQPYDRERIVRSVDRFAEETYPRVRAFFGSEWNPGVDGDPRLHILHATDLGESIAGYYSSADEFSRLANVYSNEKEMFYINLEWLNSTRDYEYYETVLAHEFQHMVHWYNDRNEETWVNEGMSELAQEIAGYSPDIGFASIYMEVPDTQLNTWSDDPGGNAEHYGSAYLFMAYFLQRFGEEMTQAVVARPANGTLGFTQALAQAGQDLTFEDVFADWVVANYVNDPNALERPGVYGYRQLDLPRPALDKAYRSYPIRPRRSTVFNFGVDYVALQGSGDITIRFQGATETRLADVEPYSGRWAWWSNRADDSDTRLTRRFDFRDVAPGQPLVMEVAMWYDIEDDYDYGYVLVSRDGRKWDILEGPRTTRENPSGNSFGPAYTAESTTDPGSKTPEWILEEIDLSDYAGEQVWIRFEYVTDDAVNYPGWFIDDIRIPAIGYSTDFEDGPDGWESEGWILTDNRLPQLWLLQVMAFQDGELVSVQRVPVHPDGTAQVRVNGLGRGNEAVLAISGLTPVTTEPAAYEYRIDRR